MNVAARPIRTALALALALVGMLVLALSTGARAATLVVTVENVRSSGGTVKLSVFASAKEWPDHPTSDHSQRQPARPGIVVFRFELPPGTYAAAGYHDENNNGKFDTTWIGLPEEGYTLSNNVRPVLSAPSFGSASFTVGPDGAQITMRMVYP